VYNAYLLERRSIQRISVQKKL